MILVGRGAAADAKRRLLERAGARVVEEAADARVAIVVDDDAAVARLRARGVLVNAVDRPSSCDFTLPAIVDRDPLLVAVGTGGASAGLAKAVRQRIEALLPSTLGRLADDLNHARPTLRQRLPDADQRRRALDAALAAGGPLDPTGDGGDVTAWLDGVGEATPPRTEHIRLRTDDPDDLTLREARWLNQADRVVHDAAVPAAVLVRARADADRLPLTADTPSGPGLTVIVEGPR